MTPVLLFRFHEVPLVTAVANMLAFPAVSPALLLGLGAAGVGLLAPGVGRPLAALAGVPLRYLRVVADRLSTAPVPWIASARWCRGARGRDSGGRRRRRVDALRRRLRSRSAAMSRSAWSSPSSWTSAMRRRHAERLTVRFLDVGQGDAALVTSPGGTAVLIDAGPDDVQVATELSALGVKRLDIAVATHPHADHVAGFPAVSRGCPVGLVLEPGCDESSPCTMRSCAPSGTSACRSGTRGQGRKSSRRTCGSTSSRRPGAGRPPRRTRTTTRWCCAVSIGDDVVLFPGDAEEPSQDEMLEAGVPIAADVLKVPHHGGDTSVAGFLQGAAAQVAVVSVGQPNDYGHPVPRFSRRCAMPDAVLRTDELGDVIVTFGSQGRVLASAE